MLWLTSTRQQRQLFEDPLELPAADLPTEVQRQLRQALSQWMQSQARTLSKEAGDEQDHI
jgi:hypothetical protein